MRRKLTSILKTANLKDEEIAIYLLLLKLQKSTAAELIEQGNLSQISVYRTLKKLAEKGLIETKLINNKQKIYTPLSFQKLIKNIQQEKLKLTKLERSLKGLDPFLKYLDTSEDNEEKIQIKEGADAMREEYLKIPDICKEECLPLGNVQNMLDITGYSIDCPEERNFIQKRMKKGIYVRMMNTPNETTEELAKRDSFEKRTLKLKEKLPIMKNFLVVCEDQSVLFLCDQDNPKTVVIKDNDLLELQRHQFEYLWTKYA